MPVKRPLAYKMLDNEVVTMSQELVKVIREKIPATETTIHTVAGQISDNCNKVLVIDGSIKNTGINDSITDLNKDRNKTFENFVRCIYGMVFHGEKDFSDAATDVSNVLNANRKSGGTSYAANTFHINAVLSGLNSVTTQLEVLRLTKTVENMKTKKENLEQLRSDRAADPEVSPADERIALISDIRKLLTGLFSSIDSLGLVKRAEMKPAIDAVNSITGLYGSQVKAKSTRKSNAKKKASVKADAEKKDSSIVQPVNTPNNQAEKQPDLSVTKPGIEITPVSDSNTNQGESVTNESLTATDS